MALERVSGRPETRLPMKTVYGGLYWGQLGDSIYSYSNSRTPSLGKSQIYDHGPSVKASFCADETARFRSKGDIIY